MPGGNGVELLKKIIQNNWIKDTKIFFLSNLDEKQNIDEESAKRISGYFIKVDMTPQKLADEIKKIV